MNESIKVCKTCQQSKPLDSFKKEPRCKEGYTPHCKKCLNKQKKEYRYKNHLHYLELEKQRRETPHSKQKLAEWWEKHREEQAEKAKLRYRNNPHPYLRRSKEQKLRDPEGYKAYLKKWQRENLEWANRYYHTVKKLSITWRLTNTLRGSLRKVLRGQRKTSSVLIYLGCSMEFFRGYLESKFTDGMSWENYGKWHIDHIIPSISFDMTKESDRHKCFHYTNLQPLWASDNCSKQDKLPNGNLARKLLTIIKNKV